MFGYAFPMSLVYAVFSGLSIGEAMGGVVMLFISLFAVFFWGSGLGWRAKKRPSKRPMKSVLTVRRARPLLASQGSSSSWTGDLRVDLPGADGVPLTGLGIGAVFCRGRVDSCLHGSGFSPSPMTLWQWL